MCKKIKRLIFAMLTAVLLSLSGCGDAIEPNELAYVLLIGVDQGEGNLLQVTYLIAVPKNLAGEEGGGDAEKGSFITTVSAPTILTAMNMVNTYTGRRITYMHTKGILFSDKLAKSDAMAQIIISLYQYREARGTAFVAVTEDKPSEILELMKPQLETNPAKFIELLGGTYRYTGFMTNSQLHTTYREMKTAANDSLLLLINKSPEKMPKEKPQYKGEGAYEAGQVPKKGGTAIQAIGGTVLRDDKMVGKLDGDETTIFNIIRGRFRTAIFSLPDPIVKDAFISAEVFQARAPAIKVYLTENGPVAEVWLNLEANIIGYSSMVDYAIRENRIVLEKAFESYVQKLAKELIARTQELNADILGFGLEARKLALTLTEWNQLNWTEMYPTLQTNVQVDFKIRRTGTMLRQMPIVKLQEGVFEGENKR